MSDEKPVLVDQPTGAPTRKTFGGFLTAFVMVFATKTAIAIWPWLLDPTNPWQPLYVELLTWLPFLIPAVQYQIKEWASPPSVIVPASNEPTVVQLAPGGVTQPPTAAQTGMTQPPAP